MFIKGIGKVLSQSQKLVASSQARVKVTSCGRRNKPQVRGLFSFCFVLVLLLLCLCWSMEASIHFQWASQPMTECHKRVKISKIDLVSLHHYTTRAPGASYKYRTRYIWIKLSQLVFTCITKGFVKFNRYWQNIDIQTRYF